MRIVKIIQTILYTVIIIFLVNCTKSIDKSFKSIPGFSDQVNSRLELFFEETKNYKDRKIAVFDGDGTVLGQVPHYLADECLYSYYDENSDHKTSLIDSMREQSNVSLEYVQNRIHFMSGDSLNFWRNLGSKFFKKYYSNKIFTPMRKLITRLKENNFEVWIITASPEAMYQLFLSTALELPITNIVGVKSVISNGIITNKIIQPVPQDHGKKEAIESFVQGRPLFAAGNSRGDKEMIEYASMINMIVNPDEHIAADQKESIADYAQKNNWLIVNIPDLPNKDFPSVSSNKFGVRLNKTKDKPNSKTIN